MTVKVKEKKKINKNDVLQFLLNNAVIILIILSAIYVGITSKNFLSLQNLKNLLSNLSYRVIIALGISGCLIMRNNDLSAGRQVGFASCIAGILLQKADFANRLIKEGSILYKYFSEPVNMWILMVALMVLFAVTFGLINGLVVSKLHVPAFIGTYGMQTVIYGICLIVTNAEPIGGIIPELTSMGSGFILEFIPYIAIIMAVVIVIFYILYNHTTYGKKMYAIGGNPAAAEVSGINTTRMTIASYMIAAAMFALAGFVLVAKVGGTTAGAGEGFELFAIAGCTIGGVSVSGGTGNVFGIILGVAVFEVLKIEMNFLGIATAWTYILQGIVIVIAIALDIRKYIAKK